MKDGFLIIDKEVSWTSRDICNKAQNIFSTKKVGHTGTLDPFATGLLIVTLNKGNKAGHFLDGLDKEYIAELYLGKKTSTGDLTSEVIKEKEVPNISISDINKVFQSMIGEIDQVPPMTSAINVNGVKLYQLAHEGIEIERQPRKVTIKSLDLLSFENNIIKFSCYVSKGTYVRTLGEQIAERLNTVGHLVSLKRTKIGPYDLTNAKKIKEVNEDDVVSIFDTLTKLYPSIKVSGLNLTRVTNGATFFINDEYIKNGIYIMINENNDALAVYENNNHKFSCLRGLW